MKAPGNFCVPANADSRFENRHFLTHRPPIISRCSPLTMRTCSPLTMRRPPPIGSPHRGILCVEKIGSVAPELQERPGTPSKPVKSTNGPFSKKKCKRVRSVTPLISVIRTHDTVYT